LCCVILPCEHRRVVIVTFMCPISTHVPTSRDCEQGCIKKGSDRVEYLGFMVEMHFLGLYDIFDPVTEVSPL
jgi:hypothetical protein